MKSNFRKIERSKGLGCQPTRRRLVQDMRFYKAEHGQRSLCRKLPIKRANKHDGKQFSWQSADGLDKTQINITYSCLLGRFLARNLTVHKKVVPELFLAIASLNGRQRQE